MVCYLHRIVDNQLRFVGCGEPLWVLNMYNAEIRRAGDHKVFFGVVPDSEADYNICPSAVRIRDGIRMIDIDPDLNEGCNLSTLTIEELLFGQKITKLN